MSTENTNEAENTEDVEGHRHSMEFNSEQRENQPNLAAAHEGDKDEDVEGHVVLRATGDDDDVEGHAVAGLVRNSDDDDVEGHIVRN